MDKARYRQKVITDLLSSPWTLWPVTGGLSAMLMGWGVGLGNEWVFAGMAGVLAGVGALATRWIFRSDDIMKEVFQQMQGEELQQQQNKLDDLDRRLQADNDPRTEKCLRLLRKMYSQFKSEKDWTGQLTAQASLDISQQVDTLFQACTASLERSLELWHAASKMLTQQTKNQVLQSREQLLDEVQTSIQQLALTIDNVHALAIQQNDTRNLAQLREELNQSLEVARKVGERMKNMDSELGISHLDAPLDS